MAPRVRLGLGAATAVAGGLAGAVYGALIEPRRVRVRRLDLPLPSWPTGLDGLRVAVVSDLHAGGPHVNADRVEQIVGRVNRERPDLIALLGDYLDPDVAFGGEIAPDEVADRLADLRAPLGVFAVLGNHDWEGDTERVRRTLREWGIEVLENDAASVERGGDVLWIVGLGDTSKPGVGAEAPFALVPERAPLVVLAHDPDVFPDLPKRATLTLAGHTHGGQVNIPLVRDIVVPARYRAGLFDEGGRRLFVSRGVGEARWPVRIAAPPEIAVLKLVRP